MVIPLLLASADGSSQMPNRKTTYQLDAEAQARVVGCLGLAYKLAHRFAFSRGLDPDEAKGVAVESLCRAAACFDPTRGIKFTAYAGKAVVRALVVLVTQEHRRRRVRGLYFSDIRGEEDSPFDPAVGAGVAVLHGPAFATAGAFSPTHLWRIAGHEPASNNSTKIETGPKCTPTKPSAQSVQRVFLAGVALVFRSIGVQT
jgi:hypothetical protein